MAEPLVFDAEIRQVKSMVDRTFNLTLNLPEYAADQASELMKHIGEYGRVAVQIETESKPFDTK